MPENEDLYGNDPISQTTTLKGVFSAFSALKMYVDWEAELVKAAGEVLAPVGGDGDFKDFREFMEAARQNPDNTEAFQKAALRALHMVWAIGQKTGPDLGRKFLLDEFDDTEEGQEQNETVGRTAFP